jgi:hypothetical protein
MHEPLYPVSPPTFQGGSAVHHRAGLYIWSMMQFTAFLIVQSISLEETSAILGRVRSFVKPSDEHTLCVALDKLLLGLEAFCLYESPTNDWICKTQLE